MLQLLSNKILFGFKWVEVFVKSSLFLKLTLLWFLAQGVFFALTTKVGIPPDENFHLGFIQVFIDNGHSPFISFGNEYPTMGEVVHTPFFLYHFLLSFPAALVKNLEYGYIFLRLLNLGMALCSIGIFIKIVKLARFSPFIRNISLFMLCNSLMFVFLSASVSYDNLFILLSLASIYCTFMIINNPSMKWFLALCLTLIAGALIKINFLGMAVVVVAVLVIHLIRNKKSLKSIYRTFNDSKILNILLLALIVLLGILATHRYGYNVVTYQKLSPDCDQVMSIDKCRQNALFARNEQVFGDRKMEPVLGITDYFFNWLSYSQSRTYGIQAHQDLIPNKMIHFYMQVLSLLVAVAFIRLWVWKESYSIKIILFTSLSYSALVFLENLNIYNGSGRPGFVVHGRYLFNVLPFILLIANHYVFSFVRNSYFRGALLVSILVVFFISSLPSYLIQTNSKWYNPETINLYERYRE